MTQQPRERFLAALRGEHVDRPPVSAWHHFIDQEYDPFAFVEATAASTERWGWDWVKINTRATLFSEIWGTQYDRSSYNLQSVPPLVAPGASLDRLEAITARPYSPVIAEQQAIVRALRKRLPEVPLAPTVFSPLTVLYFILGLPSTPGPDQEVRGLEAVWNADPQFVAAALSNITETLSSLVTALVDAGAEAIFYAHTSTPHSQLSRNRETFDRLSTPYDLAVLEATAQTPVILHSCGPDSNIEWFIDWPVDALSWDPTKAGNPSLEDLASRSDKAIVGGITRELFDGEHTAQITAERDAALASFTGSSFLLAPTCSLDVTHLIDADFAALSPTHW